VRAGVTKAKSAANPLVELSAPIVLSFHVPLGVRMLATVTPVGSVEKFTAVVDDMPAPPSCAVEVVPRHAWNTWPDAVTGP
jgi:hypothetical protein